MWVAAQLARMGGGATGARYAGFIRMERAGPVWTGEIRIRRDLLTWPLFRRRPRRIAVGLMSDLFHEEPVAHEPLAPRCTGSQGFSRGQIRNSEHSLDGKSAAWARTATLA